MEDENDIDLSLALPCGQSSSKSKGKDGCSSDIKTVEGSKSTKIMDDFRNFLHTGIQKEDLVSGPQGSDSAKPHDNFFSNLATPASDADASMSLHRNQGHQFAKYRGVWIANGNRSVEIEEEKSDHLEIGGKLWPESGNKHKIISDELNHPRKKHEKEIQHADAHKTSPPMGIITSGKESHVSVTTEDGSTAENEDVAESEADGSTSKLISHHKDGTKQYIGSGGGGSCEAVKEGHGFTLSNIIDLQGQKQSSMLPGNEMTLGNMRYGVPLTARTMPTLPGKMPNSNGGLSISGYPMQLMPPANSERAGTQSVNPGNLMFGYSPVQLPSLQTDHSWGSASHHQQLPTNSGRTIGGSAMISDKPEDELKTSQDAAVFLAPRNSEALPCDGRTSESVGGKQHSTEEGDGSSSSQTGDEVKGNILLRSKEASDELLLDLQESSVIRPGVAADLKFGGCGSCPSQTGDEVKGNSILRPKEASDELLLDLHESSVIRPGVAADLKFGGCGSCPNLPWVSTTGPGPNGKTISGVTYRYNRNLIKIVCACHSTHMTPKEFVQHACSDQPNPENGAFSASFPSNNPAASAQS